MDIAACCEMLEQAASKELQKLNIPGAAVAVVYQDELVFARGLGVSNSETGAALTPEMLLRIGSVTKVFTAYTLIALVLEQGLSVHAPIAQYVPDLPAFVGRLTIHQLLSHTAGLKDDYSHYGLHDEDALGRAIRAYGNERFFAEPGQLSSYSALGYAVAGVVIEALSGKPYAHVVQERVLAPLGMERSTFYPTVAMTYPLSQGHEIAWPQQAIKVVRPYDDTTERWPSGFLFSNISELARFMRAFMHQGRLDGQQVLSAEVIEILRRPYVRPMGAAAEEASGYGLFLSKNRGLSQIAFGGGRKGFTSRAALIPEHHFAVIQLINRAGALLTQTAERAMDLFLPFTKKMVAPVPVEVEMTSTEMQRLAGRYIAPSLHTTATDIYQLVEHEGKLALRLGERPQLFVVKKTDDGRFTVHFAAHIPPLTFIFCQGAAKDEDYLYVMNRAYKRAD